MTIIDLQKHRELFAANGLRQFIDLITNRVQNTDLAILTNGETLIGTLKGNKQHPLDRIADNIQAILGDC